nr:hypothetical protein CFP56_69875 [Quercus suber]
MFVSCFDGEFSTVKYRGRRLGQTIPQASTSISSIFISSFISSHISRSSLFPFRRFHLFSSHGFHMPPRRRPARLAAALPASRLPLGTPFREQDRPSGSDDLLNVDAETCTPSSQTTSHRHSFVSKENTPPASRVLSRPTDLHNVTSDEMSAAKLAQAKLDRQRKREEEFDAIMNAPPPQPAMTMEKERPPVARAKGKWKPLDIWAPGVGPADATNFDGLPVSEVRINTFRPASRASTLSRSISSLSQRSNDTHPSDLARHGSQDGNYEFYARHKGRRPIDQLSAYKDQPEQRQQTVEAAFDQREIYQVFGSKPPGMEFIEQTVGDTHGRLQFIQHPNGDISAHQWSAERCLWENIGQFSNIRKKVEGQLGADCLKGETADQTLQRNTLAYFRTIAKQREASVMGLPFGLKEIQAAMPESRPASTPMPLAIGTVPPPHDIKDMPELHDHQSLPPSVQTKPEEIISPPRICETKNDTFPRAAPYAYFAYGQEYHAPPQAYNDPYFGVHGTIGATDQSQYRDTLPQQHHESFQGNFDATSGHLDDPFYQVNGRSSENSTETLRPSIIRSGSMTPAAVSHHFRGQTSGSDFRDHSSVHPSDGVRISTPQKAGLDVMPSRAPTPLTERGSRGTAFKDQVDKFTGRAMQRSLSQANIPQVHLPRTVLYDPMRGPLHGQALSMNPPMDAHASMQPVVRDEVPITNHIAMNPTLQLQQQQQLTGPRQIGTDAAIPNAARRGPLRRQPPAPIGTEVCSERPPSSMNESRTCLVDPNGPWPQNFQGPFFAAETSPSLSSKRTKGYAQDLQDWWTNRDTVVRREAFYQSLMASNKPVKDPPDGQAATDTEKRSSLPEGCMTRILIPILDNLTSYIQGPAETRRDHFSRWCQPSAGCVDEGPNGNQSFSDSNWQRPSIRQPLRVESVLFGGFTAPQDSRANSAVAMDARLEFGPLRSKIGSAVSDGITVALCISRFVRSQWGMDQTKHGYDIVDERIPGSSPSTFSGSPDKSPISPSKAYIHAENSALLPALSPCPRREVHNFDQWKRVGRIRYISDQNLASCLGECCGLFPLVIPLQPSMHIFVRLLT